MFKELFERKIMSMKFKTSKNKEIVIFYEALGKNKVQFNSDVNIENDLFKYVVTILIILNVSFGINSINDNIKINNEESKLNNKIDKLKFPYTNYELRSLATKHQDIVKLQLKIRGNLKKY